MLQQMGPNGAPPGYPPHYNGQYARMHHPANMNAYGPPGMSASHMAAGGGPMKAQMMARSNMRATPYPAYMKPRYATSQVRTSASLQHLLASVLHTIVQLRHDVVVYVVVVVVIRTSSTSSLLFCVSNCRPHSFLLLQIMCFRVDLPPTATVVLSK